MSESGFKFSSYLVSKGLSLWKRERREEGGEGGGGEEGGGRVWLILILFFISFQYRDCSKRNQVRTISLNAMADTNM